MSQDLLIERSQTTLTLTLNRPDKANALSDALVDALLHAIEPADRDGTRLLVLRGAGRCFSAGFDMSGVEEQSQGDLLLRFVKMERLLQAIYHAPYDTLALAHGRNFGAGADLIVACSRRVGSAYSAFLMPGLQFGVLLGTRRLAARIGVEATRRILGENRSVSADDALELGLLTTIRHPDEWAAHIRKVEASETLQSSARRLLNEVTVAETRDADLAALVRSVSEPGLHERLRLYLEASRLARTSMTP